MKKLLIFLSLFFYTVALVLGLILYFSLDRRDLMTGGELIGYATITKPEALEIQRLIERENELSHKVEALQSDLIDKQLRLDQMNAKSNKLQKDIDTLAAKKQKYEKGQALATDLLAMRPQWVVSTLAEADDTILEFFVSYAMPFMRDDAKYERLMNAIGKSNPFLAAKIETLVAVDEEQMPRNGKASQ